MTRSSRHTRIVAFTLNVGNTHSRLVSWRSDASIANQFVATTSELLRKPSTFKERLTRDIPVIFGGVVPSATNQLAGSLRTKYMAIRFRRDLQPQIEIVPRPASRVGDDRIASALGALALDPTHPWVVVDAGTAMTINAVTPGKKGRLPRFEGGLIVPGFAICLDALATFTAQLPKLSAKKIPQRKSFIGRNTEEAILLGVFQSTVATAVAVAKGQLKELGPRARIVLTGGGASTAFQRAFKEVCPPGVVSVRPYLVDLGLFSCWKVASHT